LVSQGETGDEREMGFINAFELNSGIQQQIFHSDSQRVGMREVFASKKRAQLSSKTKV